VNAGQLGATGGDLTVVGSLNNTAKPGGTNGLLADGHHLTVEGAVIGTGSALIQNGGVLEFSAASSAKVAFGAGHGSFILDSATNAAFKFIGTITGFANSDDIDLGAIGFTDGDVNIAGQASFSGNTLTVHDNSGHSIGLTFTDAGLSLSSFQIQNHSGHVDLFHV
jgi:hypothetical protein